MIKSPMWLLIGACLIGVFAALVIVIPQARVPERQGTAPSILDTQLSPSACAELPEPQKKQCFNDAQMRAAQVGPEAREAITSSNTGRAVRGSGGEGATSGGTPDAPPAAR